MKKIIIPTLITLLTSCSPVVSSYYQVYKTTHENGKIKNNKVVFEDANCEVNYYLWKDYGDPGFSIYNKTDNDITLNLTKTFFVMNGVAYEYFQNRTFSKSTNNGTSFISNYSNNSLTKVANSSSSSVSTSYNEKPELTIPPKTSINISEFNVTSKRFMNCDLLKYPTKKSIKTSKYEKDNSPFAFYNLITYSTNKDTLRLENKFYVNEITNYPSSEMFQLVDSSACGKALDYPYYEFNNPMPDRFYIKYSNE